jgi:hypothetical protein
MDAFLMAAAVVLCRLFLMDAFPSSNRFFPASRFPSPVLFYFLLLHPMIFAVDFDRICAHFLLPISENWNFVALRRLSICVDHRCFFFGICIP